MPLMYLLWLFEQFRMQVMAEAGMSFEEFLPLAAKQSSALGIRDDRQTVVIIF